MREPRPLPRCLPSLALLVVCTAAWGTRQDPSAAEPPVEVPIGTVLPWWGTLETMPEGFELCDGRYPTTFGAVVKDAKPDLKGRFLKGAEQPAIFRPRGAPMGGGNFSSARTARHALTVAQVPNSFALQPGQDGVVDPGHEHALVADGQVPEIQTITIPNGNGPSHKLAVWPNNTRDGSPVVAATTPTDVDVAPGELRLTGTGQGHDHGVTSNTDNQPAHVELLFIIRVK